MKIRHRSISTELSQIYQRSTTSHWGLHYWQIICSYWRGGVGWGESAILPLANNRTEVLCFPCLIWNFGHGYLSSFFFQVININDEYFVLQEYHASFVWVCKSLLCTVLVYIRIHAWKMTYYIMNIFSVNSFKEKDKRTCMYTDQSNGKWHLQFVWTEDLDVNKIFVVWFIHILVMFLFLLFKTVHFSNSDFLTC